MITIVVLFLHGVALVSIWYLCWVLMRAILANAVQIHRRAPIRSAAQALFASALGAFLVFNVAVTIASRFEEPRTAVLLTTGCILDRSILWTYANTRLFQAFTETMQFEDGTDADIYAFLWPGGAFLVMDAPTFCS